MATDRRSRRSRPVRRRPVPASAYGPKDPHSGLAAGLPEAVSDWTRRTITVQLPPPTLSAGRLPVLGVDDVVELSPVFYLFSYRPVYVGDDTWSNGEHGTVVARGSLVPPAPPPLAPASFLFAVADALFILDWPHVDPFPTSRFEATGGLYLDPRFESGGELEDTGSCCRRPFRVVELRRSTRTTGTPHSPTRLDRLPDPWEVSDEHTYVVDLVELGVPDQPGGSR